MWEYFRTLHNNLLVNSVVIPCSAAHVRIIGSEKLMPVLFGGNGVASSITRLSRGNKTKPWLLLSTNF